MFLYMCLFVILFNVEEELRVLTVEGWFQVVCLQIEFFSAVGKEGFVCGWAGVFSGLKDVNSSNSDRRSDQQADLGFIYTCDVDKSGSQMKFLRFSGNHSGWLNNTINFPSSSEKGVSRLLRTIEFICAFFFIFTVKELVSVHIISIELQEVSVNIIYVENSRGSVLLVSKIQDSLYILIQSWIKR